MKEFKGILVILLLLTMIVLALTGCNSAAQATEDPPAPFAAESNQSVGPVAGNIVEPIQEELSKPVEPADEPEKEGSAQAAKPKQQPTLQPTKEPEPAPATQPQQPQPQPQQPQQPDLTGWVEFHTGSIKNLSILLDAGSVIYHDGKYYASPEYVRAIQDAEMNFKNDITRDSLLTPDAEFEIVE